MWEMKAQWILGWDNGSGLWTWELVWDGYTALLLIFTLELMKLYNISNNSVLHLRSYLYLAASLNFCRQS
jgi:hypothetical protein